MRVVVVVVVVVVIIIIIIIVRIVVVIIIIIIIIVRIVVVVASLRRTSTRVMNPSRAYTRRACMPPKPTRAHVVAVVVIVTVVVLARTPRACGVQTSALPSSSLFVVHGWVGRSSEVIDRVIDDASDRSITRSITRSRDHAITRSRPTVRPMTPRDVIGPRPSPRRRRAYSSSSL